MAIAEAPRTRKPDLMDVSFEQGGVEICEHGLDFFWLVGSQRPGLPPYKVRISIKDNRMARSDALIRCPCKAATDFSNTLCFHVRVCERRLAIRQAL